MSKRIVLVCLLLSGCLNEYVKCMESCKMDQISCHIHCRKHLPEQE